MRHTYCSLLAVSLAFLLTACGGSAGGSKLSDAGVESIAMSSSAAAQQAPMAMVDYAEAEEMDMGENGAVNDTTALAGQETTSQAQLPENRKIIRHMSLYLETQDFENALTQIRQAVADSGGYIEQENISGRSIRSNREENPRHAYFMARIPSQRLDGAVSMVSGICNIRERQENTDDVTERYYDAQARLRSLEIQEQRLLAILEKADKLEDVVSLEQALSEVRYEIESITASLRHMDSQVMYSYLEMNLDEVVTYTESPGIPKTFGEELAAAASASMRGVTGFCKSMLLGFIRNGPVLIVGLLVWVLIIGAIVWFIRWILRKTHILQPREKAPKKKKKNQTENPSAGGPSGE